MSKKNLLVTILAVCIFLFPIALFGECNHPVTWDESDFPESAFETNPNWINNTGTINSLQYKVRFKTGDNYYRDILIRIESADLHDNWLNWINNYDCDNQETLLKEDYEIICASPVTNKAGDTIIGYGFSNVVSLYKDFMITSGPMRCVTYDTSSGEYWLDNCDWFYIKEDHAQNKQEVIAMWDQLVSEAQVIINKKCGDAPNREPIIALLPFPSEGFSFQISILKGDGFQIVAHDPDGYEDLMWDTFAVIVNGTDVTDHFLQTLIGTGVGFTVLAFDPRTLVIYIMPDLQQLMGAHNLFNIQQNGEATIQLQICDKAASCTVSPNRIYFGPFLALQGDVFDPSCDNSWTPQAVISGTIVLGNAGLPSTDNDLFFGLRDPNNELNLMEAYSFILKEGDIVCEWGSITRFFHDLAMPFGMFTSFPDVRLSLLQQGPGFPVEGIYSFVVGIKDNGPGTEIYDAKTVLMCGPQ